MLFCFLKRALCKRSDVVMVDSAQALAYGRVMRDMREIEDEAGMAEGAWFLDRAVGRFKVLG